MEFYVQLTSKAGEKKEEKMITVGLDDIMISDFNSIQF